VYWKRSYFYLPNQKIGMCKVDVKTGISTCIKADGKLINTTIEWQQGVNDLFSTGA